mmetsp:Transcript_6551/g.19919  ORF Transcript_6551/g.19919 Transcript_6551/m.19919 type:complete len:294 (+) Transcript_6551:963-1844(+)
MSTAEMLLMSEVSSTTSAPEGPRMSKTANCTVSDSSSPRSAAVRLSMRSVVWTKAVSELRKRESSVVGAMVDDGAPVSVVGASEAVGAATGPGSVGSDVGGGEDVGAGEDVGEGGDGASGVGAGVGGSDAVGAGEPVGLKDGTGVVGANEIVGENDGLEVVGARVNVGLGVGSALVGASDGSDVVGSNVTVGSGVSDGIGDGTGVGWMEGAGVDVGSEVGGTVGSPVVGSSDEGMAVGRLVGLVGFGEGGAVKDLPKMRYMVPPSGTPASERNADTAMSSMPSLLKSPAEDML